ncbi:heme-binding protein [Marinobacter fonticola]|uniref:heme-binding protein n=1 Tax=Marinobacter fonticola TaxID=2603215 RepID=UPI0011E77AA6|nr:heme-binding protein [Marinobacter fonticola]
MKTKPVLALTDVSAILDGAQKEAEANGWAVTIAVADDGGHLLGLRRLDDVAPFTVNVAIEKARSAAIGRKETAVFEDMINNGRNAFLSAPLEGLLTGGVPVIQNGQVAGSIGVSGVKPDQDAQVAKAGIKAIAACLEQPQNASFLAGHPEA